MSSGKSVPKLKTDFTLLYKGMMGAYGKKSPTNGKATSPVLGSQANRIPSAPKKPTSQTPTQPYISAKPAPDTTKPINSLFRSSNHLDTLNGEDASVKPYTPAEISSLASKGGVRASHAYKWQSGFEKREPVQTNIIFNPRTISKGSVSRGSSAGSASQNKRNHLTADGIRDARLLTSLSGGHLKPTSPKGGPQTPAGHSTIGNSAISTYMALSAHTRKDKLKGLITESQSSKPPSRSSQRRSSNNIGSPKSTTQVFKQQQFGKDKLTKLLQSPTALTGNKDNFDSKTTLKSKLVVPMSTSGDSDSNIKRKFSSASSITKKAADTRTSITMQSTSKIGSGLISSPTHSAMNSGYGGATSTSASLAKGKATPSGADFKKELQGSKVVFSSSNTNLAYSGLKKPASAVIKKHASGEEGTSSMATNTKGIASQGSSSQTGGLTRPSTMAGALSYQSQSNQGVGSAGHLNGGPGQSPAGSVPKNGGLGNYITQVSSNSNTKMTVATAESSSQRERSASGKNIKKKKRPASPSVKVQMLNQGVYYMEKLERCFKEIDDDVESGLFRQHFKQTIENLSVLSKLGKTVEPFDESHLIQMPPLKDPSRSATHPEMKTIIFDLDETLIHCNEDQEAPCDARVPVKFPSGEFIEVWTEPQAGINVRPFAKVILKELAKYFEIVVFTASHACYANPVINYLDPENKYVTKRLFRENCRQISETLYVKDLTVFKGRSLKNMVLVDNAAYSYSLQLNNGIPVIPFYNNKKDTELKELVTFLMGLLEVDDVRPVLKSKFKLETVSENSKNMNILFNKLFGIGL